MKKLLLFVIALIISVTSCFVFVGCDNSAKDKYDKITVTADATLDVGLGIPITVDADATVKYKETEEGVDFVVDAVASVAGTKYNAEVYYVGGTFAMGLSQGDAKLNYFGGDIGIFKQIASGFINGFLANPNVNAVYEFIVSVLERNGVTFELSVGGIRELLTFEPDFDFDFTTAHLTDIVQGAVDYLVENQDGKVFDAVLQLVADITGVPVDQQETAIANMKGQINLFLEGLLDDEITIGGFVNGILGLIDPEMTIDELFDFVDLFQAILQIETQEVIDLVNQLAGAELPEATDETLSEYFVPVFNLLSLQHFTLSDFKDVKVCDLIALITGEPFSLESDILGPIKLILNNLTFKDLIQSIGAKIDPEFNAEEVLGVMSLLDFEKVEVSVGVKTNDKGLLKQLTFGTDDSVKMSDLQGGFTTFAINFELQIDFAYDLTGANVFALPKIAG